MDLLWLLHSLFFLWLLTLLVESWGSSAYLYLVNSIIKRWTTLPRMRMDPLLNLGWTFLWPKDLGNIWLPTISPYPILHTIHTNTIFYLHNLWLYSIFITSFKTYIRTLYSIFITYFEKDTTIDSWISTICSPWLLGSFIMVNKLYEQQGTLVKDDCPPSLIPHKPFTCLSLFNIFMQKKWRHSAVEFTYSFPEVLLALYVLVYAQWIYPLFIWRL